MAGVQLREAFVTLDGIRGDRQYAFVLTNDSAKKSFPWMTARQDTRMLAYQPSFEEPPLFNDRDPAVSIHTPEGRVASISDENLLEQLQSKFGRKLFLLCSERGIFDCQHVSAFSLATVNALTNEAGWDIDHRQFRANLYFDPVGGEAFAEEQWTDCLWAVGAEVLLSVAQLDRRCMMVNLSPETGSRNPAVLSVIARLHNNRAGLYLNVVRPGTIREGDTIRRLAIST
jgi:MOSC domain-containing protein